MTPPLRTILTQRIRPIRRREEKIAEQQEALERSHRQPRSLRRRLRSAQEELTGRKDTPGGATLGELTRAPGGQHRYTVMHDEQMGTMWLRARVRLEHDLIAGRPPGTIYRLEPTTDFYGQLAMIDSGPGSGPVTRLPCEQECHRRSS